MGDYVGIVRVGRADHAKQYVVHGALLPWYDDDNLLGLAGVGGGMGTVERPAIGKEVLTLKDCPCCDGDVTVSESGHRAFIDPVIAQCDRCQRTWALGLLSEGGLWTSGEKWNKIAATIRRSLVVLQHIEDCVVELGDRSMLKEANSILKEAEAAIIGAEGGD